MGETAATAGSQEIKGDPQRGGQQGGVDHTLLRGAQNRYPFSWSDTMHLLESVTAALVVTLSVVACGSDDSGGTKAGNNEACAGQATCNNSCDADPSTCSFSCADTSTCTATCHDGQTCNFSCGDTAHCNFDCTHGTCNTSGGSTNCECKGNCVGTCGGVSGVGGSGGGGGGDCQSACGSPSDPGYADCIAACAS